MTAVTTPASTPVKAPIRRRRCTAPAAAEAPCAPGGISDSISNELPPTRSRAILSRVTTRRRTLAGTLVAAVVVLLTPLVLGHAVAAWWVSRARASATAAAALEAAQHLAAATDAALREIVAAEEAASAALALRPQRPHAADLLAAIEAQHPALRALALVGPDGSPITVAPPDAQLTGWPKVPRVSGRRFVATPTSIRDGVAVFWVAVPVRGGQGRSEGALVGQVLASAFAAGLRTVGDTGTPVLVDPAGRVAFSTGSPDLPAEARDWSRIPAVAAARKGEASVAADAKLPSDPTRRLLALAPVGQTGWVAGVSRPRGVALASAGSGVAWTLLLSIGTLGVGLGGALLLGRRLTRPARSLAAAARALGTADTIVPTPSGALTEEFAELARALVQAGREVRRRSVDLDIARRRLDALLASSPDPVTVADPEGRVVAANAAAEPWLGGSPARGATAVAAVGALEGAGRQAEAREGAETAGDASAFQKLDLAGRPLSTELLPTTQALATGKRSVGVMQVGLQGGERRIFSAEATPIIDSAGRLLGAVTLFRDLTDRREAERRLAELTSELRARNELIEALFERLPAALALVQGPELRVRAANSQFFELAGLPDEQLAGRRLHEIFPAAVGSQVADWVDQSRRSGAVARGVDVRVEGLRRESTYWDYLVAPLREGNGRGDALLLALNDATEHVAARLKAQRTAEQVEQKGAELEAVLQSLADGIVLVDANGRVVVMNRAAEQALGRPVEKGVRPRMEDFPKLSKLYEPAGRLLPPEEAPLARAVAGEAVERLEAYILTPSREKRFLLLSATPLRDRRGRLLGAVGTFRDITREKEVESFKLQFIARAAHELRTPLTTIKGNLLLALKGRFGHLAPPQREALETATRNVDTLVDLIDDLLDITRVESGRLRLFGEESALAAIVERSVGYIAPLASGKGIAIGVQGAAGVVGYWDATKVEQVFANVLSNAVKFTPPGGRIDIRVFREAHLVTVAVRDSGIGIPRDKLALVFQPFVSLQRREAGGPRQRGTGLGLSIAQSIVEAHGGRMWAESEGVGRGTTVYLTLPLDHRRAERVRLNMPARVVAGGTPIEPSVLADLSADGASIVAPTEVLAASVVTVEIQIPAGGALTAIGEIVRVEPLEGNAQFKAGVRFTALPEADRATLLEWLRRARSQQRA